MLGQKPTVSTYRRRSRACSGERGLILAGPRYRLVMARPIGARRLSGDARIGLGARNDESGFDAMRGSLQKLLACQGVVTE